MHIDQEPVDDKKLAAVTEQLRYYHATWKPITDRPAQEGDFVRVDMVALTEPQREVFSQKTVKLDDKGTAPWIRHALIGATPGQTVEAMSEKADTSCDDHSCSDPSHHHAEEAFVPTPCRITLHEITLPDLPEIDEAFAKKMGCTTLEEFDVKVREYAAAMSKGEHRNKLRNAMYDFLVKHYPFEIPGPLVDEQVNEYVKGCIEELAPEARTDAARALIQREAAMIEAILKKNIHTDYLVGQLAHQFGLNITQQEIQQDIIRELMQNPVDHQTIDFDKYTGELAQKISRERLVEKVLDFLIDNAGKEKA
jgi:trigger factor